MSVSLWTLIADKQRLVEALEDVKYWLIEIVEMGKSVDRDDMRGKLREVEEILEDFR